MRKYLYEEKGETQRDIILVPDSAHGTNPATTAMSGLKVMEVPSDARGNVDLAALQALIEKHGPNLVGLMLTNPNTLGLFDENVEEVVRLVHEAGGLVYGDGANFNAILGIARPGDLGFDVMHYNLHKTFSTPHGGGGPGSGAVGVPRTWRNTCRGRWSRGRRPLPDPSPARGGESSAPLAARGGELDSSPSLVGGGQGGRYIWRMPPNPSAASRRSGATSAYWCGPTPTSRCTARPVCAR